MGKQLVRRLVSLLLLAIVATGGGRLPFVDALAFHESVANPDSFQSHFEASSACHDDGCSVRSEAYATRLNPSIGAPALSEVPPDDFRATPSVSAPPQSPTFASHLSRAPPLPV